MKRNSIPANQPAESNLRSGRKATIVGAVIVLSIVVGGNYWWNYEANDYNRASTNRCTCLRLSTAAELLCK